MPFATHSAREPWNKSKIVGQKEPLKLKYIWAIRVLYTIDATNARTGVV